MGDKYNLQSNGYPFSTDGVMGQALNIAREKDLRIHYIEGWSNDCSVTRLRVEDSEGNFLKSFKMGYPFDSWERCLEFVAIYEPTAVKLV